MNSLRALVPAAAAPRAQAPCRSLSDLLARQAARLGEKTAFEFLGGGDPESLSFQELYEEALIVAGGLRAQGVERGRALLLYPAGLEFVAAFFGAVAAGLAPVAAPLSITPGGLERIAAILSDARPAVVLANSARLLRMRRALAGLCDVQGARWLATDEFDPALIAKAPAEIDSGDAAFLQYSSGSTGRPKGIVVSHANVLAALDVLSASMSITQADRAVSWLPHHHDMGLVAGILHAVRAGTTTTLMSPTSFLRDPRIWLDAMSTSRATMTAAPDFGYAHCVRSLAPEARRGLDFSAWTVAITGAEPVRPQTLQAFAEAFGPCGFNASAFYPAYGLAEATLMVSGGERGEGAEVVGFDARALEGGRAVEAPEAEAADVRRLVGCGRPRQAVAIAEPGGLTLKAPGEVGEILAAGPSVTEGAPGERVALAGFPGQSFVRTGDLGFLHRATLFVAGRLNDVIILRGRNLHPEDIEAVLASIGPAAAFGIEDEQEERLVIVQETARDVGGAGQLDARIAAIREAVLKHFDVAVWRIALVPPGGIPRTSSGKLQRGLCRARLAAGELSALRLWDGAPVAAA